MKKFKAVARDINDNRRNAGAGRFIPDSAVQTALRRFKIAATTCVFEIVRRQTNHGIFQTERLTFIAANIIATTDIPFTVGRVPSSLPTRF
jgi:hypothetical protein